jgi:hypothetical protein
MELINLYKYSYRDLNVKGEKLKSFYKTEIWSEQVTDISNDRMVTMIQTYRTDIHGVLTSTALLRVWDILRSIPARDFKFPEVYGAFMSQV